MYELVVLYAGRVDEVVEAETPAEAGISLAARWIGADRPVRSAYLYRDGVPASLAEFKAAVGAAAKAASGSTC